MTIEEMKQAKRKVEVEIEGLLRLFQTATGLAVRAVDLKIDQSISGEYVSHVTLDVRIR